MDIIINLANQVCEKIDVMTELLYQENVTEGYSILNTVIAQMDQLINHISAYQTKTSQTIVDEQKLLGSVGEAFQAMEEKDIVLLADIFNYDIKEQLEQLIRA